MFVYKARASLTLRGPSAGPLSPCNRLSYGTSRILQKHVLQRLGHESLSSSHLGLSLETQRPLGEDPEQSCGEVDWIEELRPPANSHRQGAGLGRRPPGRQALQPQASSIDM